MLDLQVREPTPCSVNAANSLAGIRWLVDVSAAMLCTCSIRRSNKRAFREHLREKLLGSFPSAGGGFPPGLTADTRCWQDMSWSELKSSGGLADVGPSPRSAHTATAYLDRFLLVFGGGSVAHCYNDLHVFDTDSCTWEAVATEGTPPSPRAGARLGLKPCMLYLMEWCPPFFSSSAAQRFHQTIARIVQQLATAASACSRDPFTTPYHMRVQRG